jgi:hypothetical protein
MLFSGKTLREIHLSDNKTELLPGLLLFVPNIPVLLIDNIAFKLGLSNGTQGIFRELLYDDQAYPTAFQVNNEVFLSSTIYARKALVRARGNQHSTVGKIASQLLPVSK